MPPQRNPLCVIKYERKLAMANINNGILINYIRLSLILGVLSSISIFIIKYFEIELSVLTGICVFGVLLFSIPGYLILPGLIYDEFKTGMVFTLDQMFYFAFMIFTLGIGPALIYFVKFEPGIRAMQRNEKMKINRK